VQQKMRLKRQSSFNVAGPPVFQFFGKTDGLLQEQSLGKVSSIY